MDSRLSGEDLAAVIGHISNRVEVGAIFVDYIQKIPLQRSMQSQRYLEIKRVSELLLEQAVIQDIPVILGAQASRAGAGEHIKLEHLRESGDIEQDANLVLGIYNESVVKTEEKYKDWPREVDMSIYVLKNRGGGGVGNSRILKFDRPILRIKDPGAAHY